MEEKWTTDAKRWAEYFESKYPVCDKLDKWENEDPETWEPLTDVESNMIRKLSKGVGVYILFMITETSTGSLNVEQYQEHNHGL
jgi:hypothetical protein